MKRIIFKVSRFIVQFLFFWIEWILSLIERIQNKIIFWIWKPEYVRKGNCQLTGQCCRAIGMEVPQWALRRPKVLHWVKKWHHLRYNFTFVGIKDRLLVYECNYLTAKNTCGIQKFKPKLCRDFPQNRVYGFSKLHKGCGFHFEKRVGKDFFRTLEQKKRDRES